MFASFPAEWADPTNKIVKVLLVAFGVVVAFPYLPASDSPAFAGVSVFMGASWGGADGPVCCKGGVNDLHSNLHRNAIPPHPYCIRMFTTGKGNC